MKYVNFKRFTGISGKILSVFATLLLVSLTAPGSRHVDSPLIKHISEMRKIWHKLRRNVPDHSGFAGDEQFRKTVDDLVGTGTLSEEDHAYLTAHDFRFYGISPELDKTPMIETTVQSSRISRKVVTYQDGSIANESR